MLKAAFSVAVAALVLLHLSNTYAAIQKRDLLDVAAAKYDSSSGGGSYGGSSGGGASYGGSSGGGYGGSSGGGGGGGYGGSSGGGGSYGSSGYGSSGGGGGGSYGGSSGGGGGYGGSGGGGGSYGGSGGGGSYGGSSGGGGYGGSSGGGAYSSTGGGSSGGGDIGNVYYYYYPTSEYTSASSSSGSYSNQSPSGSYYGMMGGGGGGGKDKDKDGEGGIISSLINLSIPAVLAVVLGIPLAILLIGGLLALGAFVIGRSNNGAAAAGLAGLPVIGGLVDLNLVRSVHEAFAAYQALSTDENCRQRVVCELGYILKSSDKRATVVSVLDAMLPTYMQKHFKPLKEVMTSGGESGKCEKYVCNAAAAAMKMGPFKNIFGSSNKTGTSGETKPAQPSSEPDKIEQSSGNSTEKLNTESLM